MENKRIKPIDIYVLNASKLTYIQASLIPEFSRLLYFGRTLKRGEGRRKGRGRKRKGAAGKMGAPEYSYCLGCS